MEIFQKLQPVVAVLSPVVMLVAVIFMLYMRSKFATKEDLAAAGSRIVILEARAVELEGRCTRMNERMGEGPRAADIHKLELTIVSLSGDVKVLNEKIAGSEDLFKRMESQVNRMESFLQEHR